jgi:hypothetical protein
VVCKSGYLLPGLSHFLFFTTNVGPACANRVRLEGLTYIQESEFYMLVKLFGGLLVAAGVVAAGIASNSSPTAAPADAPCCKEGGCCSDDCCKDCPDCSCECDCCQDCENGCDCPNK